MILLNRYKLLYNSVGLPREYTLENNGIKLLVVIVLLKVVFVELLIRSPFIVMFPFIVEVFFVSNDPLNVDVLLNSNNPLKVVSGAELDVVFRFDKNKLSK